MKLYLMTKAPEPNPTRLQSTIADKRPLPALFFIRPRVCIANIHPDVTMNDHTNNNTEITLQEAWRTVLNDEALSDVTFEANDGVQVHANRGLLAARSKVFRSMLFGEFMEAKKGTVVRVGYDSRVLAKHRRVLRHG